MTDQFTLGFFAGMGFAYGVPALIGLVLIVAREEVAERARRRFR